MFSFKTLRLAETLGLLGMNSRNHDYIYQFNHRHDYPLADDKVKAKAIFKKQGIAAAETLYVCSASSQLDGLEEKLTAAEDFVIKPARGRGGAGIMVCRKIDIGRWRIGRQRTVVADDLRRHTLDILLGLYSRDVPDQALIEERLSLHTDFDIFGRQGLADIRVLCFQAQPVQAMLRLPTRGSGGKANLHQGGVGLGIDLSKGVTTFAVREGKSIKTHPDAGCSLAGFKIPFWDKVLKISVKAAQAMPLRYLGLDVAVTLEGPKMLEMNVRPGLDIQNANQRGLAGLLKKIKAVSVH